MALIQRFAPPFGPTTQAGAEAVICSLFLEEVNDRQWETETGRRAIRSLIDSINDDFDIDLAVSSERFYT